MGSLLEHQSPRKQGYGALAQDATAAASVQDKIKPSSASFLSRLLFSYATPLMRKGNERQLQYDDLWDLEGENQTAHASEKYNAQYERHNKSVSRAIWYTYGLPLFLCGFTALFSATCNLFAPQVLRHVVDAFSAPEIDVRDLTIWLGAFFASRLANAVVSAQTLFYVELVALRLTVSLKNLLFKKAMHKSTRNTNKSATTVDLSNLYNSDVTNLLFAAFQINNLWILPLQIGVVVYMLYDVLGIAAFAGLGVIGVSMLLSFGIARYSGKAFADNMTRKDARMKVIKEVFGAIQIVKLNAWETKFAAKIAKLRDQELSAVARVAYWGALSTFVLWASPLFVSTVSFAVYAIAMGETLTAAKVFTAIALFNTLRDPLRDLPSVIQQCIQAKVSLGRISTFLAMDEYDPLNVERGDNPSAHYPKDVVVAVEGGSFAWSDDAPPLLKNVNLTVKKGDLVVVHGSVGSGKSSLCSALLGEMDKVAGRVFVRDDNVAYYSQQTWIRNLTIRDNILFGKPFDPSRYQRVLDACGLVPDLAQFPGGDATEIGSKGVNLSGGQQARLCLARACYSDAELLILDSPLAAVDAVVQSEIFAKCICSLLETRTVVLVTHSPDIIASQAANYTILVKDGELKGERREVIKSRSFYAPRLSAREVQEAHRHELETLESKAALADAGRLVDKEERREGIVSQQVFWAYFQSLGGAKVCVLLLALQLLWQGCQIGSDLWLSHWTGGSVSNSKNDTEYNMKVYAYLGAATALMVLARSATVAFVGLHASRHLFDAMTSSLLHAPLRFFDANPIGRIVNRYGGDVSSVDFRLPSAFGDFLATLFFTVCQLATAVYMVNFVGVLILPLVVLYVASAKFFLAAYREMIRLWTVTSSPILSHVSESEAGVAIIRAFGREYVERMVQENARRIDTHSAVWFAEISTSQWFQVRMQLLGCGVVIVVVSALVYLRAYLSPGLVGLAFTYALSVDSGLSSLVRSWSWVETTMVGPERILEYAGIPPEGSEKLLVVEPPAQWPQNGSIQFQDVVFSYKHGAPAVLKGLSFAIKSNEKVGIVGRTGAGKSSLTMALFRINELDSGRILIAGEDISAMPLRSLRTKLSIIPQVPVLFRGTLRAYMDPFDEYADAQIWAALEKVEMKTQVSALEGQLGFELSENGENFSVGERQMLCLARALLTQTRIVVMDEATASIDHATEKKLQSMIARDFQDATVLTIAHRLATVLDSDRVMVVSDGRVVEFDSPRNLVKNPKGVFYELAKEGGYLNRLLL